MIRIHLITGFLGVGKTTAILSLLSQKPAAEKWAVLVNEFGEVGVDGAILESQGAVVKEIPGGCLCCVSGLPFQIGLNMLIAREAPDVLLIEPTGLGHPRNVLQTLRNEHYQTLLTAGANLCLVDPRQLSNPRYITNDIFQDQIQLADVLVANKTDHASEADRVAFERLVTASQPAKAASAWVHHGQVDINLLTLPTAVDRLAIYPDAHAHQGSRDALTPQPALAAGETIRQLENHGQGYYSLGWLVTADWVFSAAKLRQWLNGLQLERIKGIVITDEGPLVLNMRDGVLTEMLTRRPDESRLECINSQPMPTESLQGVLLLCRLS